MRGARFESVLKYRGGELASRRAVRVQQQRLRCFTLRA